MSDAEESVTRELDAMRFDLMEAGVLLRAGLKVRCVEWPSGSYVQRVGARYVLRDLRQQSFIADLRMGMREMFGEWEEYVEPEQQGSAKVAP